MVMDLKKMSTKSAKAHIVCFKAKSFAKQMSYSKSVKCITGIKGRVSKSQCHLVKM